MALGAYSIVRYNDHLSDQRVNLGVLLWHPLDGFAFRFSPALDRIQAIDPRVRVSTIREQLDVVEKELEGVVVGSGRDKLTELSRGYKEGLEISPPYPAQLQGLEQTLEHLYQLLVSHVPEIRRASTQRLFEQAFKNGLEQALKTFGEPSKYKFKELPDRRVNGVSVKLGIQTVTHRNKALWRAVSLQALDQPELQIARAKATALDIRITKTLAEFNQYHQIVALQEPKPRANERFKESVAWLKHEAAEVLIVRDRESMIHSVSRMLNNLFE